MKDTLEKALRHLEAAFKELSGISVEKDYYPPVLYSLTGHKVSSSNLTHCLNLIEAVEHEVQVELALLAEKSATDEKGV